MPKPKPQISDDSGAPPKKSRIVRWSILLSKFCLGVAAGMALLNLYLSLPQNREGTSPMMYNSVVGMWPIPNFHGRTRKSCYDVAYSFDHRGHRPETYPAQARDHNILIGDSFIQAPMIPDDLVVHNQLSRL
ncbi:MAG TPA: hypothetical protein VIY86_11455, partial [Pirellulaceae bacterium]